MWGTAARPPPGDRAGLPGLWHGLRIGRNEPLSTTSRTVAATASNTGDPRLFPLFRCELYRSSRRPITAFPASSTGCTATPADPTSRPCVDRPHRAAFGLLPAMAVAPHPQPRETYMTSTSPPF